MTKPRKAVIPAAGLGTRFLPATKSIPKEMIPIVDRPGIQYVVEEAVSAGCDDILIITGAGKSSIEDHFDRSRLLEAHLAEAGKIDELDEIRRIADLADVHYVRQKEPRGFGDAILAARAHVGDEPFAILVADEIVPPPASGPSSLEEMLGAWSSGAGIVLVQPTLPDVIGAYGVAEPSGPLQGRLQRITGMVEKPDPGDAPSDLAARGRYVMPSSIFDAIERTADGVGGEIQLTDAISVLADEGEVYGYVYEGPIFDVGKKLTFLQASIELALVRDDLGEPLRKWLIELAARL